MTQEVDDDGEVMIDPGDEKRFMEATLGIATLFEFENNFFVLLEQVQAQTTHIDKEMDHREAYGIMRLLRRGLTSHTKNRGIPEEDLKGFKQWWSEIKTGNGRSRAGQLDMSALYAALKSLTPALLGFTRSLCSH
jgi:hypothetical protein